MTGLEILFIISAALSFGGNVYQSNQIGELESELAKYKEIAGACNYDRKGDKKRSVINATDREADRSFYNESIQTYDAQSVRILAGAGEPCLIAPVGEYGRDLLDAQKRFIDRLYQYRLQP